VGGRSIFKGKGIESSGLVQKPEVNEKRKRGKRRKNCTGLKEKTRPKGSQTYRVEIVGRWVAT